MADLIKIFKYFCVSFKSYFNLFLTSFLCLQIQDFHNDSLFSYMHNQFTCHIFGPIPIKRSFVEKRETNQGQGLPIEFLNISSRYFFQTEKSDKFWLKADRTVISKIVDRSITWSITRVFSIYNNPKLEFSKYVFVLQARLNIEATLQITVLFHFY